MHTAVLVLACFVSTGLGLRVQSSFEQLQRAPVFPRPRPSKDAFAALARSLLASKPAALFSTSGAGMLAPLSNSTRRGTGFPVMNALVPAAGVQELEEKDAVDAAAAVTSVELQLPPEFASGPVASTYIPTSHPPQQETPPIVLLHSFDSSCLEWRRVLPLLQEAGLEAFAVDILGWGFTETRSVSSVGVEAKREHLYAFWQQHLSGRPAMFVGSSLGAATIIDFMAFHPEAVHSTALLDPQGFIDGVPPVPRWGARAGIQILRSWPLRWFGQIVAYEDLPRCATDDAIRVGRLHCSRSLWEENQIDWLLGGGYSVSHLVSNIAKAPCLILWGRQDRVLPPSEYVPQFTDALPDAVFRWVERCGHVPHLEQPQVTAAAVIAFLRGEEVPGDGDASVLGGR